MNFLESCLARIRGRGMRVVFPEGADERIVAAAHRLRSEDLAESILLTETESSAALDDYAALYLQGRPDTGIPKWRAGSPLSRRFQRVAPMVKAQSDSDAMGGRHRDQSARDRSKHDDNRPGSGNRHAFELFS